MSLQPPVAFKQWIDEVRPLLQPPVGACAPVESHAQLITQLTETLMLAGNKLLYGAGQQKVMVVGGPNVRKDYHIEPGEVSKGPILA